MGYALIDSKYPGEWVIQDQALYKGTTRINGNNDLVDEIGRLTGGTVTIFQQDTRVATNVKKVDGQRAIGTKVSEKVATAVLQKGQPYYGEANVNGHIYQAAYQPLKNSNGEIIGIWYVGASQEFIDKAISTTMLQYTIIVSISIVLSVCLSVWFARRIRKRLCIITEAMEQAGKGDFTAIINDRSKDEIGELILSYRCMTENIRALIQKVADVSTYVAHASLDLSKAAEQSGASSNQVAVSVSDIADGVTQQADRTHHIYEKVEDAKHTIEEARQQAERTLANAIESNRLSKSGHAAIMEAISHFDVVTEVMSTAAESIQKLDKHSGEIGEISTVITEIADQTNLLALNAAIEAARAGEQGRGFAVVADEVRKLAEESGKAAEKIVQLIQDIQCETATSVQTMKQNLHAMDKQVQIIEKGGHALKNIVKNAEETEGDAVKIKEELVHLASTMHELYREVQSISHVTKTFAATSEEVAAAAEEQLATVEEIFSSSTELSNQAGILKQEIAKFKL
jgi:methyl-accepting chemotaxis protein